MSTEDTVIYAYMKRLIETVINMRNAQKMYFKTRDPNWLQQSKNLEQSVDYLVRNSPLSAEIPADN